MGLLTVGAHAASSGGDRIVERRQVVGRARGDQVAVDDDRRVLVARAGELHVVADSLVAGGAPPAQQVRRDEDLRPVADRGDGRPPPGELAHEGEGRRVEAQPLGRLAAGDDHGVEIVGPGVDDPAVGLDRAAELAGHRSPSRPRTVTLAPRSRRTASGSNTSSSRNIGATSRAIRRPARGASGRFMVHLRANGDRRHCRTSPAGGPASAASEPINTMPDNGLAIQWPISTPGRKCINNVSMTYQ